MCISAKYRRFLHVVCIFIINQLEGTPYPAVIVMQTSTPATLSRITSQVNTEACLLMCMVILQDHVSLVEWLSALILHAALICMKICSVRHYPFMTAFIWKWENEKWESKLQDWAQDSLFLPLLVVLGAKLWLPVKHLKRHILIVTAGTYCK